MELWLAAGLVALGTLLAVAVAAVGGRLLNGLYNDRSVRTAGDLFVKGAPRTVMAVLAHPGDEITCAATLARMARRRGAKLVLVYLTAGEAARGASVRRDVLGEVRRAEAAKVGRILKAAEVTVLDYPDGALRTADGATVRRTLGELIARHGPSVLVTFDERIGLYGHHDHMQVGRWVGEILSACADDTSFPVRRVYHMTLSSRLIERARRRVQAFHDNYPRDPKRGLPAPSLAVRVGGLTGVKRRVMRAHASQSEVLRDGQPYWSRAPGWLYARLYGREYFSLAASR